MERFCQNQIDSSRLYYYLYLNSSGFLPSVMDNIMHSLLSSTAFETLYNIKDFLERRAQELLDENFCMVERGFSYRLLALFAPFYRFFGHDPYNHVKVYNVAHAILKYCEDNKSSFEAQPELVDMVQKNIIAKLDEKTYGKYRAELNKINARLESLCPIPEGYLNSLRCPLQQIAIHPLDFYKIKNLVTKARGRDRTITVTRNQKRTSVSLVQKSCTRNKLSQIVMEICTARCFVEVVLKKSGFIEKIILVSREIIGKGLDTKVRLACDITNGSLLVQKKCKENIIYIDWLNKLRYTPVAGLSPILHICSKTEKSRRRFFEPLCEGDLDNQQIGLSDLIATTPVDQRVFFLKDLLSGLKELHSRYLTSFSFNIVVPDIRLNHLKSVIIKGKWIEIIIRGESRHFEEIDCASIGALIRVRRSQSVEATCQSRELLKAVHSDLKPANILIRKNDQGVLSLAITDFGGINPLTFQRSLGFRSPEKVRFESIQPNIVEAIEWYGDHGQKNDVWSMGLIFCIVLAGGGSKVIPCIYAPLFCIENKIKSFLDSHSGPIKTSSFWSAEETLKSLTQYEVDDSKDTLAASLPLVSIHLWNLIKKMLKVDPYMRISSEKAFLELSTILLPLQTHPNGTNSKSRA